MEEDCKILKWRLLFKRGSYSYLFDRFLGGSYVFVRETIVLNSIGNLYGRKIVRRDSFSLISARVCLKGHFSPSVSLVTKGKLQGNPVGKHRDSA